MSRRSTVVSVDDDAIRSLVTRLARVHPSGGTVIERAAIVAQGADFEAVMTWIVAHGGKPEAGVDIEPTRLARIAASRQRRVQTSGSVPLRAPRRRARLIPRRTRRYPSANGSSPTPSPVPLRIALTATDARLPRSAIRRVVAHAQQTPAGTRSISHHARLPSRSESATRNLDSARVLGGVVPAAHVAACPLSLGFRVQMMTPLSYRYTHSPVTRQ